MKSFYILIQAVILFVAWSTASGDSGIDCRRFAYAPACRGISSMKRTLESPQSDDRPVSSELDGGPGETVLANPSKMFEAKRNPESFFPAANSRLDKNFLRFLDQYARRDGPKFPSFFGRPRLPMRANKLVL